MFKNDDCKVLDYKKRIIETYLKNFSDDSVTHFVYVKIITWMCLFSPSRNQRKEKKNKKKKKNFHKVQKTYVNSTTIWTVKR